MKLNITIQMDAKEIKHEIECPKDCQNEVYPIVNEFVCTLKRAVQGIKAHADRKFSLLYLHGKDVATVTLTGDQLLTATIPEIIKDGIVTHFENLWALDVMESLNVGNKLIAVRVK